MINPIYILFAKSSAMDKDTGAFSVFDIVEKMQITPIPKPVDPTQPVLVMFEPLRIIATWSSETEADRNLEYDFEILAFMPGETVPLIGASGKFRFEAGKENHRMTAVFGTPLPITKPGTLRFQSRVRVTGTESWQTQSYAIPVEALPASSTAVSSDGSSNQSSLSA